MLNRIGFLGFVVALSCHAALAADFKEETESVEPSVVEDIVGLPFVAAETILEKFFDQWDSGGAVWCAAPVLQKLIAGKPLGPLTGEDSEWMEVAEDMKEIIWQNVRCGTVFKTKSHADGEVKCYDIDVEGRPPITFPYNPERAEVPSPVVEFNSGS